MSEVHASSVLPEFIRYPKPPGVDPVAGLKRTALHRLVKGGQVESISVRQPGRGRGIRLIRVSSLLAYLERQPNDSLGNREPNGAVTAGGGR